MVVVLRAGADTAAESQPVQPQPEDGARAARCSQLDWASHRNRSNRAAMFRRIAAVISAHTA